MGSVQSRVKLRVVPRAKRSVVVGRHGDGWKVRIAAPPEDGRANAALLALLADSTGLPVSGVEIVAGMTARDKTVVLSGIDAGEVDRRLDAAQNR
ncbi:MAG TPA: DUF167 domain-containing protein [Gaiellaceae bacterium]|nr:DUF167 domain-containing protein [Gaiellaceae bacterium]